MGLYIQGMQMPRNEPLLIKLNPDGSVSTTAKNGYRKYATVSVPPHGKLGDLDKLVEKIDGIWDCNDMVFKPNDHCCNIPEDCKGCKWVETKNFIRRMVANAQTVIPASGKDTDVPTREEEV